jgi:NADH-quinone oxidoreductase subunit K
LTAREIGGKAENFREAQFSLRSNFKGVLGEEIKYKIPHSSIFNQGLRILWVIYHHEINISQLRGSKFPSPPFQMKAIMLPLNSGLNGLSHFSTLMIFSFILFMLGLLGIILNRKNLIIILMSIEILLLSINYSLLEISLFHDDLIGQIFSLYILTVAAAESAIGLAILIIFYRIKGTISVKFVNLLKG